MKKKLFVICFVLFVIKIDAQIQKGTINISGMLNSFYKTEDTHKDFYLVYTQEIGMYLLDNFNVSIEPSLIFNRNVDESNSNYIYITRIYGFSLGPSISYFFGQNKIKPYLYVGSGIILNRYAEKLKGQHSPEDQSTDFQGYLSPGAGINYLINEQIGLNFRLKYNLIFPETTNNIQALMGITFFINKNQE